MATIGTSELQDCVVNDIFEKVLEYLYLWVIRITNSVHDSRSYT